MASAFPSRSLGAGHKKNPHVALREPEGWSPIVVDEPHGLWFRASGRALQSGRLRSGRTKEAQYTYEYSAK